MAVPLRVLLLEDSPDDAELTLHELRRGGFAPEWRRVDNEHDYLAALDPSLDLVLADYSLPQFDGINALRLLQERGIDVPLILVSGTIGEEVAVTAMRQGAADYLIKDRLARLGPAVAHAVEQKRLRDERRRAEIALHESEERFRSLIRNVSDIIMVFERDGTIRYGSPSVERVLGYSPEELTGLDPTRLVHPEDLPQIEAAVEDGVARPGTFGPAEARVRHQDGTWRRLELIANNQLDDPSVNGIVMTARDITERSRAESQLRESEARFRAVSDNSSDVIIILDSPASIRYVSSSVQRIMGYRPQDVTGTNFYTYVHPEDLSRIQNAAGELMRQPGKFVTARLRVRHANGSWRTVEVKANNLANDPAVRGVVVAYSDITERTRAEDALREAEARYRGIVENALEGIFQTGFDGRFLAVNPAMARMFGYDSSEELMGEVGAVRQLHVDLGRQYDFVHLMQAQGSVTNFEFQARRKDGGEIWVSLNARAVRDASNRIAGIEGILADITERKQAQQALERSARQNMAQRIELEGILTHLGDGLLLADNSGRVTLINPAARGILGLSPEEAQQGRPEAAYWHAVTPDGTSVAAGELPLARALAGERGPARDLEALVDGELRLISVSAAPLSTLEGRPHGAVAVLRDVTEVRRAQERVVESERLRALGEMASGVAHDFNNLLAVIVGRADVLIGLTGRMHEGGKVEPHVGVIKQAALDGAETVKRLQTFSGVAQATAAQAMDLVKIVHDVIEFSRPRWKDAAEQRGVTIDIETETEPLPPLQGSPAELREVLVNLIFNAVDAMPSGGTISITLERREDEVWLQVQDTGTGMPEAVRKRIFEPFFTTKGTRGAGLGLSMSYGIITRMGGRIMVESVPDAGTTFTIVLPYHPVELVEDRGVQSPTRPLEILLVDDQPQVLSTAALMLELEGHTVTTAESGQEALTLVQERIAEEMNPYDVVLTDLGMPGMNGLQLIAAVRATGSDVPCVLVTGWGIELADEDVEAAGAQGVLPKPFSSAQLREVLQAVTAG